MTELVLAPPADIVPRSISPAFVPSNRLVIDLDTSPESAPGGNGGTSEQLSTPEHIEAEGSDPDSPAASDSGSSTASTTHIVSSPEDSARDADTETSVSTVTIKNPELAETFTWTFTHTRPVQSPGNERTNVAGQKSALGRLEKSTPDQLDRTQVDVSGTANGLLPSLNVSLHSLEAMKVGLMLPPCWVHSYQIQRVLSDLPVNPLNGERPVIEVAAKPSANDSPIKRHKEIAGLSASPSQEGFGTYLTPHQRGRVMSLSPGHPVSPAGPSAFGGLSPKVPSPGTPGISGLSNGLSAPQTPLFGNYGGFMPAPYAMSVG